MLELWETGRRSTECRARAADTVTESQTEQSQDDEPGGVWSLGAVDTVGVREQRTCWCRPMRVLGFSVQAAHGQQLYPDDDIDVGAISERTSTFRRTADCGGAQR